MKKYHIAEILTTLTKQVPTENQDLITLAIATVDNIQQDQPTKSLAIKIIRDKGYEDLAHFLELLNADYTSIQLGEEYAKKIFTSTTL